MRLFFSTIVLVVAALIAVGCSSETGEQVNQQASNLDGQTPKDQLQTLGSASSSQIRTQPVPLEKMPKEVFEPIEWIEMIPEMDLAALRNPPQSLIDIEDGSEEDQLEQRLGNANVAPAESAFQKALVSTNTVATLQGKAIKIPGFIVPLEFSDDQTITEFFLVPYFGACIHLPPPPPNQIIHISHPEGIQVEALYDPFWVYGVVDAGITKNSTATSAYRISLHHFEAYYESDEEYYD